VTDAPDLFGDFASEFIDGAGARIFCRRAGNGPPLLLLHGLAGGGLWESHDDIRRRWADDVTGVALASGHHLAEEHPTDTERSLLPFITEDL
jgi:hypothetical protein